MASSEARDSARQRKTPSANGLHADQPPTTHAAADKAQAEKQKEMERLERERLVLWRQPVVTLHYFVLELALYLQGLGHSIWRWKKTAFVFTVVFLLACFVYHMEGPHQSVVGRTEKLLMYCAYWMGLGILSSVGLGTGLHTFILYLGPFIASVTMAAYECGSTKFPEPPYPNQLICPDDEEEEQMSMWKIMNKVRLEAIMWGAGTAIGELPPYFMARAARLSGENLENDDYEELEELIHEKKEHPEGLSFMERAKLYVHGLVKKVGFFGILLCAAIPNPLFDLAGITCGHFLVPFWTFFGATLIGKSIIKMHLQKLLVIFLFTVDHVEQVIQWIGLVPMVGQQLQTPFREFLERKKAQYHHLPGEKEAGPGDSLLSWVFEKVIVVMVAYFILSIVNSSAQSYHKRLCQAKHTLDKTGVTNFSRVVKVSKE